jgi:threonine/homoserine/homoserine lactone efflux protein
LGYVAPVVHHNVLSMPSDLLLALLGYAVAASITPGPNNLLVLTSGLNHGVPRSLPLIAGISFGFAFMLVVVGVGLGALIRSSPGFHTAAKMLGLAYMLWLAWKVAASAPSLEAADARAARPLSALAGAMFQWVNPKAWAIALSATGAFSVPDAALAGLAWVACVFAVVALASLSAWAAFGSLMRRLVDNPMHIRIFNIAMALLLVASALPVAYELMNQA